MNLELENKTVLVTGSTAGIRLAIATSLARKEATVIINGRTKKRVNDAIKQIRSQYSDAKLEPLVADVSVSSAVASTIRQFPKVDILINNHCSTNPGRTRARLLNYFKLILSELFGRESYPAQGPSRACRNIRRSASFALAN